MMTTPGELLGRDAELADLTALLDDVAEGHARAAVVCGEAGIGKTSLVEVLVSFARKRGFQVAWGRCWEGGGAAPFAPWVQVLRTCTSALDHEQLSALAPSIAGDVARLVPDLRARLSGRMALHESRTPDARLRIFDSVHQFLRKAAGDGLVVALDDLHASDETSLHLLRYLVRTRSWTRLLVVGTYRTTAVDPSPAHRTLLDDVSNHVLTIHLHGLALEDVESVLARAGGPALASKAGHVRAATGGNPFLVHEAARGLPRLPASGPTRCLEGLDQSVRSVLAAAAVLGREFGVGPLSRLTGGPPDDTLAALGAASELALVEEVGPGRWSFTHAPMLGALTDPLTSDQRALLHRRASEVLQDTGSGDVFEVAHHVVQAFVLGESVPVVDACAAAAESAVAALADEEAVRWFRRGLEVTDGSAGEGGRRRYELLLGLGEALLRLGAIANAQDAFHGAIVAAQALGSVELAAEAAVRIAPHAVSDATVIGALDDALCDLPDADSPLRSRVLVSFARVMQSSSVGGAMLRSVNGMGLEMARRIGDPHNLWAALWQWHQNGFNGIEPVDERIVVARELVATAGEEGDPERAALARTWLAVDLYEAGSLSAARAELGAVLRDADDLRQPFLSWAALTFAAQVALFEGRLAEAEALARQAFDAGSECRTVSAAMVFHQQLAAVRRHQGRFGELEQIGREALTQTPAGGYDCRYNPLLVGLAGVGRAEEARALVERMLGAGVIETLFPVIVPDSERGTVGRLCCPVGMADVIWALDDVERAGPLYEMLLPSGSRHVLIMEAESRGVCALYLGQLATLLGRFDNADSHFRMAHELHDRIGARVWAAHGRVDHARMLIRRDGMDDRGPAIALLSEARTAYEAMTMNFYASRAGDLLERLA